MECRAAAEKAVPQTPLSSMVLYLPVSLADFSPVVQQAVTIFHTRAQGSWGCCLDTPLAASKVWVLGLTGKGQLVQQHRGAQGRQDGYMVAGSCRQQTDRQSPLGLKSPAQTQGGTLGKGCGDTGRHQALPLWARAGKITTLHLAAEPV